MNDAPEPATAAGRPWTGIAAGVAALWFLGYGTATALVRGNDRAQMLLGDLVYLGPLISSCALSALASSRTAGRERLFWRLIAVSIACLLIGEGTWSFYELVLGIEAPVPSLADVGYLASGLLIMPAAVVGFGGVSRERRLRAVIDATVVVVAVGAVGWRLLISPQLAHGFDLEVASQIAYPLIGLALLVLLATLAYSGHRNVPAPIAAVALAYAIGAVGDSVYSYLTIHDLFQSGGWIDLTWQAQYLIVGVAAVAAAQHRERRLVLAPFGRDLGLGLVLVGIALALLLAVVELQTMSSQAALLAITVAVLGLVARWYLTVADLRNTGIALDAALAEQERLTVTDELTSLHNRRYLVHSLSSGMDVAAIMFIDLDRFKEVNDSLGHDAGDAVLRQAASRLRSSVRDEDLVVRLGGDEFAIVVAPGSDPAQLAERLLALLREPYDLPGATVSLSGSIGIALANPDVDAYDLLRNADLAMYQAKAEGRDRYARFGAELYDTTRGHYDVRTRLEDALDRDELRLEYQPVIDLRSGAIVGVEAMPSWTVEGRALTTADLLALAEEAGLVVKLGRWVLERGCTDLVGWRRAGWGDLYLAVNASESELASSGFNSGVAEALSRHDIPPERLVLEITERGLFTHGGLVPTILDPLVRAGVRLSFDNFGTGYAALTALRTLPFTAIKLDRSLVADLGDGPSAVVDGVAYLAARLGLEVVAEGVETNEQCATLRQLGIGFGQGSYLAPPRPADELVGPPASVGAKPTV